MSKPSKGICDMTWVSCRVLNGRDEMLPRYRRPAGPGQLVSLSYAGGPQRVLSPSVSFNQFLPGAATSTHTSGFNCGLTRWGRVVCRQLVRISSETSVHVTVTHGTKFLPDLDEYLLIVESYCFLLIFSYRLCLIGYNIDSFRWQTVCHLPLHSLSACERPLLSLLLQLQLLLRGLCVCAAGPEARPAAGRDCCVGVGGRLPARGHRVGAGLGVPGAACCF